MKRIAVLLSGMPRNLDKVYQSHLNIFKHDGYEFDFFIHAWKDCWYKQILADNIHGITDFTNKTENEYDYLYNQIKKTYDPRGLIVEDQTKNKIIKKDSESLLNLSRLHKVINNDEKLMTPFKFVFKNLYQCGLHLGQLYSLQACCKLKLEHEIRHNFKYDYVIKSRLDLYYKPDIHDEFKKYIKVAKSKSRMLFKWMSYQNGLPFVGDMNYIGASDTVDKLCLDIYDYNIKVICREISGVDSYKRSECGNFNNEYTPEAIIGEKLQVNKIDAQFMASFPNFFPYRDYHREMTQNFGEMIKVYQDTESKLWS